MKICLVNRISSVRLCFRYFEFGFFFFLLNRLSHINVCVCFFFVLIQAKCLRTGLRSVPLRNKYSEELELATLLVQIQIKKMESY